jgi:signal transduction histidine kinase/FixJ family two-component response regulator
LRALRLVARYHGVWLGQITSRNLGEVLTRPFKHLRTKLLVSMLAVVFLLTAAVLVLVQARMKTHVREDLASTLRAESRVYAEIENARRDQARQSALLIADQPSLKAMMSTNDRLTVEDASASLLDKSHADLLILENPSGQFLAFHSRSDDVPFSTVKRLMQASSLGSSSGAASGSASESSRISSGDEDWWFAGGHLYDVSLAPIVSGAGADARILGRIALGREVTPQAFAEGGAFGKSALALIRQETVRQNTVLLSSLPGDSSVLTASLPPADQQAGSVAEINIAGERYLASFVELPGDHPVRLYSLQSFDQATEFLRSLNRMLITLGAVAVLVGALIAFFLSKQITRPLEQLAVGARLVQQGDFEQPILVRGNDEVADLTRAFEEMRNSLRQSRDGLLRSARLEAVGRLAGGVAHDFNNLVMIIKGYSELLLDNATPAMRPQLEEIKNAGERASALTRQLLAFSRKQVLSTQVLDPNQTVRNMAKMLRVLIGEDIELVTSFSDEIGRVKADPGQLEQVVMNLAVNARDAMPGGGKLIIETQASYLDEAYVATHNDVTAGSYVLIAVTDSGCGMSKETLAHIFEPFFTTKELGKGTGLGLATVYGIVKQSRGHISVYSEPGVGTTFKVYLPSLDKSLALPVVPKISETPRGTGTILLVEDEPALRKLAAESLKRLGYTVLQAGNGLEGLTVADQQIAQNARIEVVVTDIVMPRMGGPELVKKLREKYGELAVIFMSGYTEAAALENIEIGRDAVLLNKPFSTDTLARKIAELQRKPVNENAETEAKSKTMTATGSA